LYEDDCDQVLRDLEAFIDGELPRGRALVVAEHLATCSPCFGHGEFRRRVQVIIRSKSGRAADLPPPHDERVPQPSRSQ
jgi:anti-sigma factor (TIGR02949 family)